MAINVSKTRLPVEFELGEKVTTDSRFQKVKIWVAHTGENLNNSYFEKEVLEEMAGTLSGIPIVGYVQRANEDGEEDDFKGHENEIIIKSNGLKIRYAGHAYGFVPEESNYQFEIRDGKEWLTAEGFLWTHFRDAIDIFKNASGVKSQSMEVEQVEGEVDDIGRMVYSTAVFSALCILGEEVNPAMTGSTIEFFSNKKEQYQNELNSMKEAFSAEKGVREMPAKETKEDINSEEFEEKEEVIEKDNEVLESTVAEPDSEKENEFADKKEDKEEKEEKSEKEAKKAEKDDEDEDDEKEDEEKKSFSIQEAVDTLNFQLSHSHIRNKISDALSKEPNGYSYIIDVFDDNAIVEKVTYDEDYEERHSRLVSVKYTKSGDSIEIGEEQEVFGIYVNAEEKAEIEDRRAQIESLTAQLEELNNFKEGAETAKKEDLVAEFAEELGEDISNEIRGKFAEFSVEQVEKEVAFEYLKKAKSEKEADQTFSVGVTQFKDTTKEAPKYGTLEEFFIK